MQTIDTSRPVLILGTGCFGRIALEILQQNAFTVYGFLDDDPALQGMQMNHVPVLGLTQDLNLFALIGTTCNAFVALAPGQARLTLINRLANLSILPINAIHRHASLAADVELGEGNLINVGVSLGPATRLGNHCILAGHNMIAPEATLQDHVYLGPGAVLQAGVTIHPHAQIGATAVIMPGITIGRGARIPAGTIISSDIPAT